ncbi:hypothetical protein [Streptomyces sp. NPDC001480]|uniref:hypothetical protein n=1 Tax=Streptomyces sp. NPDC001480 TaxID=3364577 RepID=UPI0036A3D490
MTARAPLHAAAEPRRALPARGLVLRDVRPQFGLVPGERGHVLHVGGGDPVQDPRQLPLGHLQLTGEHLGR